MLILMEARERCRGGSVLHAMIGELAFMNTSLESEARSGAPGCARAGRSAFMSAPPSALTDNGELLCDVLGLRWIWLDWRENNWEA